MVNGWYNPLHITPKVNTKQAIQEIVSTGMCALSDSLNEVLACEVEVNHDHRHGTLAFDATEISLFGVLTNCCMAEKVVSEQLKLPKHFE